MSDYPSFDLSGRVALVTGAARGLGNAIARALANAGSDVVLGLRDANTGSELAAEIEKMGRRVLPVQMDITRRDQIESAVARAVGHFGRIDILVNNAGLGPENPAEDVTEEDFDLTVAVNLKGTFFTSQVVGRHMIEQKGGRIINLGSQAGHAALPGESIYCMTKAGIAHLTKCLAVEWGQHNINVNNIAPTFIATPGTEHMLSDPAFKADVEERIAGLHRVGRPVDVCGAVIFLAAPASSLVTGATIFVDGGWTAR